MRTRTDDIQDNVISLGSKKVVTTPFGAAVVFSCSYPLTIEVASEGYTVQGASVVDSFVGTGSLAAGFAMTLNNGDATDFLLGTNLPVAISWAVTGVSTLTFYLNQCTVEHGATIIPVVKDGCYAHTLNVVKDANSQGFNFPIFKGVGETDPNQKVKCSVNVCEVDQCQTPTQCPATLDDKFYGFQV